MFMHFYPVEAQWTCWIS